MVACVRQTAEKEHLVTEAHITLEPFVPVFPVATEGTCSFKRFIDTDSLNAPSPMLVLGVELKKARVHMQHGKITASALNSKCLGTELRHGH